MRTARYARNQGGLLVMTMRVCFMVEKRPELPEGESPRSA